MTGEEMERAIEFLLQSQANFETRLAAFEAQQRHTDEQIAETNRIVQLNAETVTTFIQTVTRALEGQDKINANLRAADARADERLNKLIGLFEQHIIAGH
jgi:predicted naringenin-chalcone synthase